MKKLIVSCILCLMASLGYAQETDTLLTAADTLTSKELRRQRVANRNFHYNILGGPSFSPDFGFLVGGSALMTFRMNPKDIIFQERQVSYLRAVFL